MRFCEKGPNLRVPLHTEMECQLILFLPLTLSQTTNFRLFQTQRCLQTTIFNLMKIAESPPLARKHRGKRRNCSF